MIDIKRKRQDHLPDLRKIITERGVELGMGFDTSDADEALAAVFKLKGISKDDNWPMAQSGDAVSGDLFRLPENYPAPREILREHFPRTANQCNFSGVWGYDADHATIIKEFDPEINPDEKFDGVSLEYAFIDKRIREELIFSRSEGERFEELDYTTIEQRLLDINGVPHDYILVEVTAYPEREWNELKVDWENHNCYEDDPEGREANLARKEACKITYQTEYYFNVSDFF